ncbi:MAG TPA: hypothetical protein VMV56_06500 [Williamwhitmania sp.]|nr:hypothetical protein [Williamwhitmania sp.]
MDKTTLLDQLFITALKNVDQSYYSTVYQNIEVFKQELKSRAGQYTNDTFERYGERVFCYELYHQLRIGIDEIRKNFPDFLTGALLQGEVKKMMITGLLKRLHLNPLQGEIVPDFLIHSPSSSKAHYCAVEVKCINDLSEEAFMSDVSKLADLITNFNYEQGYFITVNSDIEYTRELLEATECMIYNTRGADKVKIICKPNQKTEAIIRRLSPCQI